MESTELKMELIDELEENIGLEHKEVIKIMKIIQKIAEAEIKEAKKQIKTFELGGGK